MRYENFNFTSSFSNASGDGKEEMVVNQLGRLIAKKPKAILIAINDAGLGLPMTSDSIAIVNAIQDNADDQKLINNLSAVILLEEKHSKFFGIKGGGGDASGGDGGFGKAIGGLFKKDPTTGKSKIGGWFKKNKDKIGKVGVALGGALLKGGKGRRPQGGGGSVNDATEYYEGSNTPKEGDEKKPMSMAVKIGGGILVLTLIVGVIMIMRMKGNKKQG